MSKGPGHERTDDLNGSTHDVTTVHFNYGGVAYSSDLDPAPGAGIRLTCL